jgi:hypothetical protein
LADAEVAVSGGLLAPKQAANPWGVYRELAERAEMAERVHHDPQHASQTPHNPITPKPEEPRTHEKGRRRRGTGSIFPDGGGPIETAKINDEAR